MLGREERTTLFYVRNRRGRRSPFAAPTPGRSCARQTNARRSRLRRRSFGWRALRRDCRRTAATVSTFSKACRWTNSPTRVSCSSRPAARLREFANCAPQPIDRPEP